MNVEAGSVQFFPATGEQATNAERMAVPPAAVPLRVIDGQTLHWVRIQRAERDTFVPYINSGSKAYVQYQRAEMPIAGHEARLIEHLFSRHPELTGIQIDMSLNDFRKVPGCAQDRSRRTFVVDLRAGFPKLRADVMAAELMQDVQRVERLLNELRPGYRFRWLSGDEITAETLALHATFISAEFGEAWAAQNLPLYRDRGAIGVLSDAKGTMGVCLLTWFDRTAYYLSSGNQAELPPNLEDFLLYGSIEELCRRGFEELHLGGVDAGYARFGASERQLNNIVVPRDVPVEPPKPAATRVVKKGGPRAVHFAPATTAEAAKAESTALPPSVVPIKVNPDQTLHWVRIHHDGRDTIVPYIESGAKAYVQYQRAELPIVGHEERLVDYILLRHPTLREVIVDMSLNDFSHVAGATQSSERRTYLLDLRPGFVTLRAEVISRQLRKDVEREERRFAERRKGYRFRMLSGDEITRETLTLAAKIVSARLSEKVESYVNEFTDAWVTEMLGLFRDRGAIGALEDEQGMFAVGLVNWFDRTASYVAAGYVDDSNLSPGKIVMYRVIEELCRRGFEDLYLGGTDWGYKSRFGAVERHLNNVTVQRDLDVDDAHRAATLELLAGVSLPLVEAKLGRSLEDDLGTQRFENLLHLDFMRIEENAEIGTDSLCRRYQATSPEAFHKLMDHAGVVAGSVFLDVGCGKGKMMQLAASYPFARILGLEIAASLTELAAQNLSYLNLSDRCAALQRDIREVTAEEFAPVDLFYLYNPFHAPLVEIFLDAVEASRVVRERPITIVYCNALHDEVFAARGIRPIEELRNGHDGWRWDHSTIYKLG